MTYYFHGDRKLYFEHQRLNASRYVIPFIDQSYPLANGSRVLEVGCGEGGVLKAFVDRGCTGTGVELDEDKLNYARSFLRDDIDRKSITLLANNIFDGQLDDQFRFGFNLIVLKDVIEHIQDRESLLRKLNSYLRPDGRIYLGFPPLQMPFGGHQQMCTNRLLSRAPYLHLIPARLYRAVLKLFGERPEVIDGLLEVKKAGLSIEEFERIVRAAGYEIANRRFYLVNPIYEFKFKLRPRPQFRLISGMPYVRNFVTTCAYYLIRPGVADPVSSP